MTVHALKADVGIIHAIRIGLKPWEVRKNDRPEGFHVGDFLHLQEYDRLCNRWRDDEIFLEVLAVWDLGPFGVPGYVGMTVKESEGVSG